MFSVHYKTNLTQICMELQMRDYFVAVALVRAIIEAVGFKYVLMALLGL